MTGTIKYTQPGFLDSASERERVSYGFYTRRGGLSDGIYASLNCGVGSGDDALRVTQNRARVAKDLGVAPQNLLGLYQIHSDQCVYAAAPWSEGERPQADAMVSDVQGMALGILTADCAPVLFYGRKIDGAPVIGAAHAGWKGALGGVLKSTVREMEALGAQTQSLSACVGPCIGKNSYEVDEAFAARFVEQDECNEKFFSAAQKTGHLMFDLSGYCAIQLALAGVQNVALMDKDTYSNEGDFFSYRRKTHRGEDDYGRQISVIAIIN